LIFHAVEIAGVCSFALLFNPCILEPNQFILHEETDEQLEQMTQIHDLLLIKRALDRWIADG